MRYIDKIIEGEKAFNEFWAKFRPGEKITWCAEIGHCHEVTVELFYERSDREQAEGKPFRKFYWLQMPSKDDRGFLHPSDRRGEIHKMIREGRL